MYASAKQQKDLYQGTCSEDRSHSPLESILGSYHLYSSSILISCLFFPDTNGKHTQSQEFCKGELLKNTINKIFPTSAVPSNNPLLHNAFWGAEAIPHA